MSEIDRAFEIYIKERFQTYAAYQEACERQDRFAMDWIEALPEAKRQHALERVAQANDMGACSLVRFSAGKNCDVGSENLGTFIVVEEIVKQLATAERVRDGRVIVEVLATYV